MAKRNAEVVLQNSTVYPFRLRAQALSCVYCEEGYEDPIHFRRHVDVNHTKFTVLEAFAHIGKRKDFLKVDCTNIKCRICSNPFPGIKDVAEHLVKEHNCKINLDYEIGMQTYRLEKGKWFCLLCEEKLPTITDLCRHMAMAHYKNCTCDVCGRTYMTLGALSHHMKYIHSGQFVCRRCWKTFPTLEEKKEHQKNSTKCLPYSCTYCVERFQTWIAKNKHLVEKHGCHEVKYDCTECGESFDNRKRFNTHYQKMHTKETFKCSCGRPCLSQTHLYRHKLVCLGNEKIHKCSVCSKAFAKKFNLKQHMWIHSDVKQFECKPCNRTFNQKVSYTKHMKVYHSEENK